MSTAVALEAFEFDVRRGLWFYRYWNTRLKHPGLVPIRALAFGAGFGVLLVPVSSAVPRCPTVVASLTAVAFYDNAGHSDLLCAPLSVLTILYR